HGTRSETGGHAILRPDTESVFPDRAAFSVPHVSVLARAGAGGPRRAVEPRVVCTPTRRRISARPGSLHSLVDFQGTAGAFPGRPSCTRALRRPHKIVRGGVTVPHGVVAPCVSPLTCLARAIEETLPPQLPIAF